MSADTLERLQGASEVQAVERSCTGSTEGLEDLDLSAHLCSCGYSDGVALPSGQGILPAPVCCCDSAAGSLQRFPQQAKVGDTGNCLVREDNCNTRSRCTYF